MPLQPQTVLKPFAVTGPAGTGLDGLLDYLKIDSKTSFSYFNPLGNRGDGLIHLGTRQFFAERGLAPYELPGISAPGRGDRVMIGGSGAWFSPWCCGYMERYFTVLSKRFSVVVVLPSTYDAGCRKLVKILRAASRGVYFGCREKTSFELLRRQVKNGAQVYCDRDMAFHFDYGPWQVSGEGVLYAFRGDEESSRRHKPAGNKDISVEGLKSLRGESRNLAEVTAWLDTIAAHQDVHTDRAHVAIAAALCGKNVFFYGNSYHKNESIYRDCLSQNQRVHWMGYAARWKPFKNKLRSWLNSLLP